MSDQTTNLIIAIVFFCILPISVVSIAGLGFFFYRKQSKELQRVKKERDTVKSTLSETGHLEAHELRQEIEKLEEKKKQISVQTETLGVDLEKKKQNINQQLEELNRQITVKKNEVIILDDDILLQSFGFYKPKYGLENSESYRLRLDQIRAQQAEMIKTNKAAFASQNWTVNNNQKEGERMVKDYIKIILRSFNDECDSSIAHVKFNNITAIEKKIHKSFDDLNKLGQRMTIAISQKYLNLKLAELYLCHEYQIKKQEEKEEQKRIREQMREEAKVLREIEELKLKIEKEENHFNKAIVTLDQQIQNSKTDIEREIYEKEKFEIKKHLTEIEKDKQDILNREQNTRAGYVYIISNIGSFGENIYKIGVTRRLDPTDRVDELGDASVPFRFDIHATIFSDDAPKLENALHKAFENKRLNIINRRREFFNITLEEIEEVVKENFAKPVEFIKFADAPEYRQSQVLRS